MKLLLLLLALPAFATVKSTGPKWLKPKKQFTFQNGPQLCKAIEALMKTQIPQQQPVEIALGKNLKVTGKVGITGPSNGTFSVANLIFRLYDTHEEGLVYKDKCLKAEFQDLNKDGFRDLQLSGTIQRIDEKEHKVSNEFTFDRTYIYVPATKMFAPASGTPNPFVELVVR